MKFAESENLLPHSQKFSPVLSTSRPPEKELVNSRDVERHAMKASWFGASPEKFEAVTEAQEVAHVGAA
eukprot:CAMPEP_0174906836 /NCGR_PEP_ID=MMETSP0167-20121228/58594_1 /TAXON_ID=38298 /ORGANISM="Rhodella maculata, Strain CCMP736" /LENGTH=68 /DNA_ID=CAMNT_0016150175 /DNA_START=490 /DNA_END=693 /DNA_ORIENTATION=-